MLSFFLFAVSAVILVGTAARVARWVPALPGSRYWTFLAAVSVQLTLLHMGVSLFHQLTPMGFLVGQVLLSSAVLSLLPILGPRLHWRCAPVAPFTWIRQVWSSRATSDPIACALVLSILLVLAFSLTEQMLRPVTGFDERMYNCSRVAYWHQHRHIWSWISHNEAQLDLPFGSEVFFSWPLLFTKIEWTARLVHWLGFPALTAGIYTLSRTLGGPRRIGLIASLVIAATPGILVSAGLNQKQDIWTTTFLVGVAYWTVQCLRTGGLSACLWSGAFLALAANVKITNIAVTPVVAAASLMAGGSWRMVPRRWALQTVGGVSGILLSGLVVTFAHNMRLYGNPLASPGSKQVNQPDFSVEQTYTHAVRVPFFLFELPEQPIEPLRVELEAAGKRLIERLGAAKPLPMEEGRGWPGAYRYAADPVAYRYSLGGTVWFVCLLIGAVVGVRQLIRQRFRLSPDILILAMSGVLLGGLVFLLRWMNGAPDRYWFGPYAIGITASIALLSGWLRGKPVLLGAALVLVPLTAYPAARGVLTRIDIALRSPPTIESRDEPFTEAITLLPAGSRIVLFGHRNVRDYGLFLPRDGFANQVFPYGKSHHFDPARLARLIEDNDATHILFEDDGALGFHWDGGFRVEEIVEWLDRRPGLRLLPLGVVDQRLYRRTKDAGAQQDGFGGYRFVERLEDPEGPYPDTGPTAIRWGTGDATTVHFNSQGEPLMLRIEAKGNNEPNQTVLIRLNGVVIGSHTFSSERDWHLLTHRLAPAVGANTLTLEYASQEGERRLAVLYRTLRIVTAPE